MLLPAAGALPSLEVSTGFSIMTYNVLIPNSVDGWWCYKYYGPNVPAEATGWPHRQSLLRERIVGSGADIVALQETSPESFEQDWAFMADAGYDCAMLSKGRMRPATFWKRSRWALCTADGAPVVPAAPPAPPSAPPAGKGADGVLHGDRTLTTMLRPLVDGAPLARIGALCVVNVHLSAGPEARRRLRQVHDTLDSIRKLRAKAGLSEREGAPIVIVGDFNSQGRSGVRELLEAGEVNPDFRESGDPTELDQASAEVTSKPKRHGFGRFVDALGAACEGSGVARPPTIVAAQLQPAMQLADGGVTPALVAALDEAFDALSTDGETLSDEEEAAWLLKVNKAVGRGSEYRAAVAAKEGHGGTRLTRADFHAVYASEVAQGKFWGVEHDLREMRPSGAGLRADGAPPFTADFDYVWYGAGGLRLAGAQPPLEEARMADLLSGREHGLPDESEPSDHLPVAAVLEWATESDGR